MRAAGIFIYFFFVVLVYTQQPQPSPEPTPEPQPSPPPQPSIQPTSPVPAAPSNSSVPTPEPAPDPNQHIYDIVDYALKAALIATGLFWVLFGFRYMHVTKKPYVVTLLLAGFLIFYYITYQLLYRFIVMPGWTQNWLAYTLAGVAGIIGACLFYLSYDIHVGRFFFSALSGVLFSTLLFIYTPLGAVSLAHQYQLAIIGGVGLILGLISIPLYIIIPIIVSSFNGAFLICNAIDSLAKFSMVADLLRNIMQSPSWDTNFNVPLDVQKNWQIYVILGCIILVTLFGVIIKYRLTAREIIDNERNEKGKGVEDNRDAEQKPLMG